MHIEDSLPQDPLAQASSSRRILRGFGQCFNFLELSHYLGV
jgi:hypothetical protein